jgi:hypothetical protein
MKTIGGTKVEPGESEDLMAVLFRLRYDVRGGHIHCRLFERRPPSETWEKNGDLVFDEESWPTFRDSIQRCGVEVLREGL